MDEDDACLIGLHIGDGSLYKTNSGLVWELRGGLDEKEFYDEIIVPLTNKVLNINIVAKKRSGGKNGCYGVCCSRKKQLQFFVNHSFSPGKKFNTVIIPAIIIEGNNKNIIACLRGLFATDGTIYLAKINKNKQATYPVVEFASASKKLRDQIVLLLSKFGLDARVWTYNNKKYLPTYFLRLAGKTKVSLFAQKVGFLNLKHQRTFEHIKQYL